MSDRRKTSKDKSFVIFSLKKGRDRRETMLRISNSVVCEKGEEERGYNCNRSDLRCGCGSLMARLNQKGIELKCRRCKRIIVVPLSMGNSENQKKRRGF